MMEKNSSRREFLDRARIITLEHFEKTAHRYDEQFPDISSIHEECLEDFLSRLKPSPEVLDAACGTGKYFHVLTERTSRLLGIDQSAAMLITAREKYNNVETREVSLQALKDQSDMTASFDGVICIDALEWIFHDDWLVVMEGFSKVLKPNGYAYITVEIPGEDERFELAHQPIEGAVKGEIRVKYWYNYFPDIEDVNNWIDVASFDIELERLGQYYRHLILRKRN